MRAVGVLFAGVLCSAFSWGLAEQGTPAKIAPAEEKEAAKATVGATGEGTDSRIELRIEREPIPPPVLYQFSRTVGPGRLVKKEYGSEGEIVRTYQVQIRDGKPAFKTLVSIRRTEPEPVVFLMGRAGYPTSRTTWTRGRVMTMEATAYDPSAGRGKRATYRTANGMPAGFGKVAVDPKVIPLGTKLFIEGYGFAIAADTGSAIKGMKIDLGMPTRSQALRFGRQPVRVHVLKT